MEAVEFKTAYYIKLGRGGKWAESSIQESKARIGWLDWTLEEINQASNQEVRGALKKKHRGEYKSEGAATMDINALEDFVSSAPDDIWVTFHAGRLWWCRLGEGPVHEDEISKYRLLSGRWHDRDINGHILLANQIPGCIAKVQGFRAVICHIAEVDDLRRLINDEPSESFQAISRVKSELIAEVGKGLTRLHWKDFEILVDLLFRGAGWRRISLLGESMKYVDMELVEPMTGDMYQVQVKASATPRDLDECARSFAHGVFRKIYFVVHTPRDGLAACKAETNTGIELVLPGRLARMVVESGLTDWLLTKIR